MSHTKFNCNYIILLDQITFSKDSKFTMSRAKFNCNSINLLEQITFSKHSKLTFAHNFFCTSYTWSGIYYFLIANIFNNVGLNIKLNIGDKYRDRKLG